MGIGMQRWDLNEVPTGDRKMVTGMRYLLIMR